MDAARKAYKAAVRSATEAILAFSLTQDLAFGMRAYQAWRIAESLKDEAFTDELDRLFRDSQEFGAAAESLCADRRVVLERSFDQLRDAVFKVLDEIAAGPHQPSKSAETKIARHNVVQTASAKAGALWQSGATKADLIAAVAAELGLSSANARKLLDEGLSEPGAISLGLNRSFDAVVAQLKEHAKAPVISSDTAKGERVKPTHPWKDSPK